MAERKLMSEREAIERFVDDGDCVYVGYTSTPVGLVQEIIRQGRTRLEAVGASVGVPGTMLLMAGCVDRVRTGYLAGALRPGAIQDMMASGAVRFEDYSNQALALMLMAGALGMPFVPTRSFLGTDYLTPENTEHPGGFLGAKKWAEMTSPFDGEKVVALPALRPDVVLHHAQRGDEFGNIQTWGHLGDARWALWAGRKVVVSVEELVPHEVVMRDPGRTVVPGALVSAVVHMPYGGHPTSLGGFYEHDYGYQARTMSRITKNAEEWNVFAGEWIYGVADRAAYVAHYCERFGPDALEGLAAKAGPSPAPDIVYGHGAPLRFRL